MNCLAYNEKVTTTVTTRVTTHREQEEELLQLPLPEVVGQVLHRIAAHAGDVLVLPGVLSPQAGCAACSTMER
jgi:hypothetical protein